MKHSRDKDGTVEYERSVDQPSPTVREQTRCWRLHTNRDQRPDGSRQTVEASAPAPAPAPALTAKSGGQWAFEMPATTIAADPRITARCHHDDGSQGAGAKSTDQVRSGDYDGTEPIALSIEEASILQSFRRDYPWQGTKTSQFRQCGNAFPPVMARAVVAALVGELAEVAA